MLSLGTGFFKKNDEQSDKSLVWWAQNATEIAINSQVADAHVAMMFSLNENYIRIDP